MQSLFQTIRRECDAQTWSRGVELVRAEAVVGERCDDEEAVLRVQTRRGLVSPTVHLYLDQDEWDCDCPSPDDPCEHVAAAVIALRQARAAGRDLPSGAAARRARVGYRFQVTPAGLTLGRAAVFDDGEQPLPASLAALATGRVDGPEVVASDCDLRVEKLLVGRLDGPIPHGLMERLLQILVAADDVQVDGVPVRCGSEPALPSARLSDRGDGFVLRLHEAGNDTRRFSNGATLRSGVLRPTGDPHLSHRDRRELPEGRYYPPDAAARLVAEVLPALRERIPVEIDTERLPESEATPPRIAIATERDGSRLGVRASIVYGDPATAQVEDGRLVHVQGAVPLRNPEAEARLERRLRQELGCAPGERAWLDAEAAIAVAPRLERLDPEPQGSAHRDFYDAGHAHPDLDLDPGGFRAEFRTAAGGRADAGEALRAWRDGESRVALNDGGFATLPADWLERFGGPLADLLAARDASGTLPTCALPDLAHLCEDLGEPPPPGFDRLRALIEDFDGLPEARLPDDLQAELRGYQLRGVRWLGFLREAGLGGLLADDMGLGKTLQALCALRGRSLVVAPTSVLVAWEQQARQFRPSLRICVYHGPQRELDPDADLTLTSYAILRLDADALCAREWDCAVLDEAQAIKNPDSQVARAALRLRADFRLTLTGTPVENRLEELWSQLQFSNPGLLGSRADFRERWDRPIANGEPGVAERLRQRIAPFVLRRLKRDVAPELPPRIETVLHCELGEEQRRVYDGVRAATRRDVVERLRAGGSVLEALEALLRLRQAACHPALVPGQPQGGSSAKLEVLLETLDEAIAEGHKALVFSQWTSLLDQTEPALRGAGIAFARLDGSTRDRAAVVDRFQADDGPPVLLISLRAGGTGLTLTAADHVFLLDPWWNPAVEDQAADRAHRIGQDRTVLVHRLVARDTVEERILALQARKRELAEAALAGADRAGQITRDELIALLD